MSDKPESKVLLFIDVETTGLDPDNDLLLEVGLMMTDLQLNIVATNSWLIWSSAHRQVYDAMKLRAEKGEAVAQLILDMHSKNGLWVDCIANGNPEETVEQRILDWMRDNDVPENEYLVGNSVHFDRNFLRPNLPGVYEKINRRIIDISTLKVLAKKYAPDFADQTSEVVNKVERHRVIDDMWDSRNELQWYLGEFIGQGGGVL